MLIIPAYMCVNNVKCNLILLIIIIIIIYEQKKNAKRKKYRKNIQDWELLIVGRLCVVFLVFVSILWIPILQVI
jgi:hypothetical protein